MRSKHPELRELAYAAYAAIRRWEENKMKEYREISEDRNIPQRMFTLPDGNQSFLSPTGYEIWSDEDPVPLYEYSDQDGNLYYTR